MKDLLIATRRPDKLLKGPLSVGPDKSMRPVIVSPHEFVRDGYWWGSDGKHKKGVSLQVWIGLDFLGVGGKGRECLRFLVVGK
jgi:hypothetical protein